MPRWQRFGMMASWAAFNALGVSLHADMIQIGPTRDNTLYQAGGVAAGRDVGQQERAGRGAVAPPRLGPVGPVAGSEVQHTADRGHVRR